MISELGGMKAILQPMIDNLTPIFTVIFLIKLMKIIKQSQIDEYFVELKNTISKAYEDLQKDKQFISMMQKQRKFPISTRDFHNIKYKIRRIPYQQPDMKLHSDTIIEMEDLSSQLINLLNYQNPKKRDIEMKDKNIDEYLDKTKYAKSYE